MVQLCDSMVGLLFPGQGAQVVGMGEDLANSSPAAKQVFEKADSILGFNLSQIIFKGPEEELTQTKICQPAIYVTSLAALEVLKEKIPTLNISSACGLSLGEFSACAALGVFSFEEGLQLVQHRGSWMEEAGQKTQGGMVSIVGLDQAQCEKIAKGAGVEIANINSPEQIVLSGSVKGVEAAKVLAETTGAKRAVLLKVSGAFHSSLMNDAGEKLKATLEKIKFQEPKGLFLSNVTGAFETDPEKIKENLSLQVTHSVQWVKTLESLASRNEKYFIELSPGKVLKGLARKTNRDLTVDILNTAKDLEKIIGSIKEEENVDATRR